MTNDELRALTKEAIDRNPGISLRYVGEKVLALLADSDRLADARDALYVLSNAIAKQRDEEKAMQGKLAKLRRYTRHDYGCNWRRCTCGLGELLPENER